MGWAVAADRSLLFSRESASAGGGRDTPHLVVCRTRRRWWIPERFRWSDAGCPGIELPGEAIYQMHVGTFTSDGTRAAAIDQLPRLAELGITVLEVMPVADFPGRFGWGYDGVNLFAPTRLNGEPDDFGASSIAPTMTARTLLGPNTPMLFVSQEYGASSPFPYFADHERELAERVAAGRLEFLLQFPSITDPEVQVSLTHPADPKTLKRSKLDHTERESHAEILALHRDLLRLRREDPVLRLQRARGVDGSVLGTGAFVLRFFGSAGDDRLLLVNLDRDLTYQPAPEPLLAPPAARRWAVLWSSEDTRYGGTGRMEPEVDGRWRITGHAAVLLNPVQVEPSGEPNRTISPPTRNTP